MLSPESGSRYGVIRDIKLDGNDTATIGLGLTLDAGAMVQW